MSKYFSTLKSRLTSANSRYSTGSTQSEEEQDESSSESEIEADVTHSEELTKLPSDMRIQLDASELLGALGWSTQICSMHYNEDLSLMFVGTEDGSLHVHGLNQQWIRPAPGENPNSIVSILNIPIDYASDKSLCKIILLLADGSIELLEFNWRSVELIDSISSKALGCKREEKVVTMYVDEAGMLPFAYLGTSCGRFYVIECMKSSIRVCEYDLPRFSREMSKMTLVSMKICPKDERYIGLAYFSSEMNLGLVVIYDLSKKKISSQYNKLSALTLEWDNTGKTLFAGTITGEVYALGIKQKEEEERQVWKYSGEDSDTVQIRKLVWLSPQEGDDAGNSCLFVLIGSHGAMESVSITNPCSCAVVALHFDISTFMMTDCLMFPPPADENVTDFIVVPCTHSRTGLLMLSGRLNEAWSENSIALLKPEKYIRSLYLYPCPSSRILDWILETGLLLDPIKITAEVKIDTDGTTLEQNFTCLASTIPSSSGRSLGMAVIGSAQQETERTGSNYLPLALMKDSEQTKSSGAMANTRGDVVFLGDSCGSIKVFRVNPVKGSDSTCMSTYWALLSQFSFGKGSSPIRHISLHEEDGVFIAFNDAGEVGLWKVTSKATKPRLLSVYQMKKGEQVTAISLAHCRSGLMKIFIGTNLGNLYFDSILDETSKSELTLVKTMQKSMFSGRSKSICSLYPSMIKLSKGVIPVVYVVYSSGIVEVICSEQAVSIAYGDVKQMAERNSHAEITALCVIDEKLNVVNDWNRSMKEGAGHPTYLIASMSSALIYYRLDKFTIFDEHTEKAVAPFATIKSVSNCRILHSGILHVGHYPYICSLDEIGVAALVTLERRHPPVCYSGLLDKVFKQQSPYAVREASLCANGNCYLLVNNTILVAKSGSSVAGSRHPPPATVEVRNLCAPGDKKERRLLSGREHLVEKHRKELESRRVSTFMSMSLVTDLRKTFATTREKSGQECEDDGSHEVDEDETSSSALSLDPLKTRANDVKSNMVEAKRNLLLRGEKIEELQIKSEEMALATSQYKADAMNKRAYLEKKKNRWSLF